MSNRPLNALYKGKLQRLASFPSHKGSHDPLNSWCPVHFRIVAFSFASEKDLRHLLKEAFDFTIHLEKNYPGLEDSRLPSHRNLAWGQVLSLFCSNGDHMVDCESLSNAYTRFWPTTCKL